MSVTTAVVLAAVALVAGVVLLVVAGRLDARVRVVERVRVPARSLSERWTLVGDVHEVEYPAPDGTPLRATIRVVRMTVPGQPYLFDGSVWVARDDPTDVTPRSWGRQSGGGLVPMILGVLLLVAALGLGVTAAMLAFVASLPG